MTEAQARAVLAAWDGMGGVEAWLAEQHWRRVGDGWEAEPNLQGWSFSIIPAGNAVRIVASPRVGKPAEWIVPA